MARTNPESIPYIDPRVEHVGLSRLRRLNGAALRKVEKTMVIQDQDEPLAVLLSYEQYLLIQDQLQAVLNTVELLSDPMEAEALGAGLRDAAEGKSTSLKEIRASLKRRK